MSVIYGQSGADTLTGGIEDDAIYGLAGDDALVGGGGNDTLDGGEGVDVATLTGAPGDYATTRDGADWIFTGATETVRLHEMEQAQFADRLVFLDGTNNAPYAVAPDPDVATNEDAQPISVNLTQSVQDFDAGQTLTPADLQQTGGRAATFSLSGSDLVLDPAQFNDLAAGQTETLTFAYNVGDGTASVAQTLTVTVAGVNDAPVVAAPLTAATDEDAQFLTVGLLQGAADPDQGATLAVADLLQTGGRSAAFSLSGSDLVLDPAQFNDLAAGQTETLTFAYNVGDGTASVAQTLTVTVAGVNDAPTANNDAFTTTLGAALRLSQSALTANDTDPDAADALGIVSVVATDSDGVPVIDTNGDIVFKPRIGFYGVSGFDYTVSDGHGGFSTAHAAVNVGLPSRPPADVGLTGLAVTSQTKIAGALPQEGMSAAVLADGTSVVVWTSALMYAGADVYAQRYDAAGAALGGRFTVNSTTSWDQGRPAVVALTDGGFVVSWEGRTSNLGPMDIFQQRYNTTGTKIGSETRVNTTLTDEQQYVSSAALQDGGWVTTWTSYNQVSGGVGEIYQQRYGANGAKVGGENRVNTTTSGFQVWSQTAGLEDGGWVVAWESQDQDGSGRGVYQQRYGADGVKVGAENRLNVVTAGGQTYVSISGLADGGWVAVWQSENQDGGGLGVYGRVFNADGSERVGERLMTQAIVGNQYQPSVVGTSDGGFVVQWAANAQNGVAGYAVYAQRFLANGEALTGQFMLSEGTATDAARTKLAPRLDGGFISLWNKPDDSTSSTTDYELTMRIVKANQSAPVVAGRDSVVTVNKELAVTALFDPKHGQGDRWTTGGLQQYAAFEFMDATAGSASGAFVVNGVERAAGESIMVSVADLDAVRWRGGDGVGSDTARVRAYDGNSWSAWVDSRVATVAPETQPTAQNQVKTAGALAQEGTSVAVLADGSTIVAWSSAQMYGGSDVHAQRYNADGATVGGRFTVNANPSWDQGRPAIAALADGGFVISWEGRMENLGPMEIFQQRYDSAGVLLGTENRVNTFVTGEQQYAATAALQDGGWVTSWTSYNQVSGGVAEIYQQRYGADGAQVGGETRVNTNTSDLQAYSRITGLKDGGWVVAWESQNQDGGGRGVYQQRYAADGATVGGETRLNAYVAGDQTYAAITALDDGGWVAVWQSVGQDGDGTGVYGRIFNADGSARSGERLIAQNTAGHQYHPAVTGTADGGFVAQWGGAAVSGSGYAVYGRRFSADGNPSGNQFQISASTTPDVARMHLAARADGGFVSIWNAPDAATAGTSDWELDMKIYKAASGAVGQYLGSSGNDVLFGSAGADTLTGGAGADAFRFENPNVGVDFISDFQTGVDRIELSSAGFGDLPAGVLEAGRFALDTAGDADDRLVFDTTTRVLSYDADGSGAGAAVGLLRLNVSTLTRNDIFIV
jgi:VCBS repeat-containing protein